MKSIEELSKELYEEVLKEYYAQDEWSRKSLGELLDEKIAKYNDETKKIIQASILAALSSEITKQTETILPNNLELSNMLYNNGKRVANEVKEILFTDIKANKAVSDIALKLYDGYGFNDHEILDAKKKLPKYMQKELDRMQKNKRLSKSFSKYIDKIRTKPLKSALKQIEGKLNDKKTAGLEKALKVMLEEKSRYYANRIAVTETHRAFALSTSNELLNDEDVEFVKWRMSVKHPMVDICDYYASLDIGYGKGIIPKEMMITQPLHPHCLCKYEPYYKKVKKRTIKNPQKHTMEQFSEYHQRAIVGSEARLFEFKAGKDIEEIFNENRAKYPIQRVSEVLGYNTGMKTILSKETIAEKEKIAVTEWSSDAKKAGLIRDAIRKNFENLNDSEKSVSVHAETILDMFKKYDSSFSKESPLYRGKSFYIKKTKDKELYNNYISRVFESFKKGTYFIPDLVFRSTSKSFKEALKFAEIDNLSRRSIIVTYSKRFSSELDISNISRFTSENEVLIQGGLSYKVVKLETDDKGNLFITLEEIK